MKICVTPPLAHDRGMARVSGALARHCPEGFEIIPTAAEADLVVLHAMGRLERLTRQIQGITEAGKRYVMIQYAIRSTKTPHTAAWLPLWRGAVCVWSYYDLPALCREDGTEPDFRFYHSPLGTDFDAPSGPKRYLIATSGLSYLTESVRECVLAARQLHERVFHVGPELHVPGVACSDGMSDEDLAVKYSQCEFVSGLRRIEGFEFPVIEGLLCGARPVCFDRPHYRQWFDGLAEFIPEQPRERVIESLCELFLRGARPVSDGEKAVARGRFDWATIVRGFYSQL